MSARAAMWGGPPAGLPLSPKSTKEAAAHWIAKQLRGKEHDIYVLGLTFKQAVTGAGGQVYLNRERVSEALRVYFRRIDWAVFKNASRRSQKAVERACCIEGDRWPGKRLHAHALVVAPPRDYMDRTRFTSLLNTTWRSSPWGMKEFYCEPMERDLDCNARYLVKTGVDAMDWSNCRLSGL